jgi:hypothetical protein
VPKAAFLTSRSGAAPVPGRAVAVDLLVDWAVDRAVRIAAGDEAEQRQLLVASATASMHEVLASQASVARIVHAPSR